MVPSAPCVCCGPGDVRSHTRPLGRVILALPSVCVCLGGPPYQAQVLLLTFAVSDEKIHDKKRGPRASDLGWSSAYSRAETPGTPSSGRWCALASSARMAAMGGTWLVGKPIEGPQDWGPDFGGLPTRSMCRTFGPSFSRWCPNGLLARHMLHRGRTSMMPGLLEGFLQHVPSMLVGNSCLLLSDDGGHSMRAQRALSLPAVGHVLQICCPLLCQGEASVA